MRTSHIFLLSLVMLTPSLSRGQSKCPWINEATAGGILGGSVTATVNTSGKGDGFCEFSRRQGSVILRLHISVGIMTNIRKQFSTYIKLCGPKTTPLPAIGNEAVTCSIPGKYAETVVGRVRDQAFVVSVSSSLLNDSSMTQEMRGEKAHLVAEQLAGVLF